MDKSGNNLHIPVEGDKFGRRWRLGLPVPALNFPCTGRTVMLAITGSRVQTNQRKRGASDRVD